MGNEVAKAKKTTIAGYLANEAVKANVESIVGEKDTQRFISSVVSAVQTNPELSKCTNASIVSAALLGHSLNLPQSPQIGMFYMVPFKNKKKVQDENGKETTVEVHEATFQLSYRGMLQLAMRSGQYKAINVTDIREGEVASYNPIEDAYEFTPETDMNKRMELKVIGYYAYFEMINGFKKGIYWTREQIENHAKKYSAAYRNGWNSLWKSDFDAMAKKTMLRQLISKWGIMSVEMERAYVGDQAVIREDGTPDYIDNVPDEPEKAVDVLDVEAKEIKDGTDGK
jgi:recombination protein RecT